MRHRVNTRKFGRTSAHRVSMFRNMVSSLIEHERVETTHEKAREVGRLAERMISLGKRGDLHARRLALRGWPGPLTLIIPASSSLCDAVHLSTRKIAVRVPGHAVSRRLAAAAGHALTSTSANISGEPPSSLADVVAEALGGVLDVLIDAGPTPGGEPSTIVDATGREPLLVRAGAIAWERVLEFSSE